MLRYMSCCGEKSGILKKTKRGLVWLVCLNKGCGHTELCNITRRARDDDKTKAPKNKHAVQEEIDGVDDAKGPKEIQRTFL